MILVRHAQPEIEPHVDPTRWRLSASGRAAAQVLAKRLRHFGPDAVFASVEPKAKETADIVASSLGLSVTEVPGLHEQERGGVPFFAAPAEYREAVLALFATPDACVFGSESGSAARLRFAAAVDGVSRAGPRQPVIVAHGTVIALYIAERSGRAAADLWQQMRMPCFAVLDDAPFTGIQNIDE